MDIKEKKNLIIGLTGSWGSGCTTAAEIISNLHFDGNFFKLKENDRENKNIQIFSLSKVIGEKLENIVKQRIKMDSELGCSIVEKQKRLNEREENIKEIELKCNNSDYQNDSTRNSNNLWNDVYKRLESIYKKQINYKEGKIERKDYIFERREVYQDLGNASRERSGDCAYLIGQIIADVKAYLGELGRVVVINGIKNLAEHQYLESLFPNYFLINVNASYEVRCRRVADVTGNDFFIADRRDAREDFHYGQQVQRCVDHADVVILNDKEESSGYKQFAKDLLDILNLFIGNKKRPPTDMELYMTSAYTVSLKSNCRKRKVGAVIVKDGHIIASGFNDVPRPNVCVDCSTRYADCYRDAIKKKFGEVDSDKDFDYALVKIKGNNVNPKDIKNYMEGLETYNKHLDLCRAVHAEERAIIQSARFGGISLNDSTVYTTTFPCQLCAKKIIEVGIRKVVYCEPYPYVESKMLLKDAKVELEEFSGVKSKSYFKLFRDFVN